MRLQKNPYFEFLSQPKGVHRWHPMPSIRCTPPTSIYPIITISESHENGGRVSYEPSEDNRRWLELLTAFGIPNGHYPSKDEIVNESIRQYFMRV